MLLRELPGVTPWPSSGNFVLCQLPPGRALKVYEALASRGIFVRRFDTPRLEDYFRVSIGMPDETDALIAAMRALL